MNPFKVNYNLPGSEIGGNEQTGEKRWGLNPSSPTYQQHNPLQVTVYISASIPEFAKREQNLHKCTNLELVTRLKGITVLTSF